MNKGLVLLLLGALAGCGGAGGDGSAGGGAGVGGAGARVSRPQAVLVAAARGGGLVPDPEAPQSSPQAASAPAHVRAILPSQAASVSPSAPTDAQVRAELSQMQHLRHSAPAQARAPAPTGSRGAMPAIDPVSGTLAPPAGLPRPVAQIIAGGNAIADFPYVYGGGHASFVDSAYDCSGSLSYALAAAGLLAAPITSGELARWGAPGPGRYVTIFANDGHTFMYVDGVRFDTSFRGGPLGSRWQTAPRSLAGFVVRHPPGL